MGKLKKFVNNPKEYRSPNDSFVARGVHINKLVEYVSDFGGIIGGVSNLRLDDGAVTYIDVGNIQEDRSIHIMYTIQRGSSFQEGILRILCDGSSVFINDDFQDNGTVSGVVFTVDVATVDIRLIATLTSTGEHAIFNAQIKGIGA